MTQTESSPKHSAVVAMRYIETGGSNYQREGRKAAEKRGRRKPNDAAVRWISTPHFIS